MRRSELSQPSPLWNVLVPTYAKITTIFDNCKKILYLNMNKILFALLFVAITGCKDKSLPPDPAPGPDYISVAIYCDVKAIPSSKGCYQRFVYEGQHLKGDNYSALIDATDDHNIKVNGKFAYDIDNCFYHSVNGGTSYDPPQSYTYKIFVKMNSNDVDSVNSGQSKQVQFVVTK